MGRFRGTEIGIFHRRETIVLGIGTGIGEAQEVLYGEIKMIRRLLVVEVVHLRGAADPVLGLCLDLDLGPTRVTLPTPRGNPKYD